LREHWNLLNDEVIHGKTYKRTQAIPLALSLYFLAHNAYGVPGWQGPHNERNASYPVSEQYNAYVSMRWILGIHRCNSHDDFLMPAILYQK
jgi:hypothetical protein